MRCSVLFSLVLTGAATAQAVSVVNGAFESNANLFTVFPGYNNSGSNPSQITGWSNVAFAVGINSGNGIGTALRDNSALIILQNAHLGTGSKYDR